MLLLLENILSILLRKNSRVTEGHMVIFFAATPGQVNVCRCAVYLFDFLHFPYKRFGLFRILDIGFGHEDIKTLFHRQTVTLLGRGGGHMVCEHQEM